MFSFIAGNGKQVAEEIQCLGGVEILVKVRFLGQIPDLGFRGHMAWRTSEDLDMALRWEEQPEQHLDGGGFSGPVGPEQTKHLATLHFEIHTVHRTRLGPAPEVLEDLGQTPDDDNILVGVGGYTHGFASQD